MVAHNLTIMMLVVIAYISLTVLLSLDQKVYGHNIAIHDRWAGQGTFIICIVLMLEIIGTTSAMGTAEAASGKGISSATWNLMSTCLAFTLFAYLMAYRFRSLGEYTIWEPLHQIW